MKCKVITVSETQLKEMVRTECSKMRDVLYQEVLEAVIPQFLAICMDALKKEHFGKVRLLRFLENVKSLYFSDSKTLGVDLLNDLKKDYDIDLDAELDPHS